MAKVIWFSRHPMTELQSEDLKEVLATRLGIGTDGQVEVVQIDRTIQTVREIESDLTDAAAIAIVAPLPLQIEFLRVAGERPVLICRNHRIQVGDGQVQFVHAGWTHLKKVEVVTEELSSVVAPDGATPVRSR